MSVFVYTKNLLRSLVASDEGASLVEYALLVSLIAIAAVVAVTTFGTELSTEFSGIADSMP
jgi:pilus assembly protein Flp/PilA